MGLGLVRQSAPSLCQSPGAWGQFAMTPVVTVTDLGRLPGSHVGGAGFHPRQRKENPNSARSNVNKSLPPFFLVRTGKWGGGGGLGRWLKGLGHQISELEPLFLPLALHDPPSTVRNYP